MGVKDGEWGNGRLEEWDASYSQLTS
jgi:hypothetical protein